MTELEITSRYVKPQGMFITYNGVQFYVPGRFACFYRWAAAQNLLDRFMEETKELWQKSYNSAVRAKQEAEEKKRRLHESYQENLRIKQNARKYARRHPEIISGDNAQEVTAQTPCGEDQLSM